MRWTTALSAALAVCTLIPTLVMGALSAAASRGCQAPGGCLNPSDIVPCSDPIGANVADCKSKTKTDCIDAGHTLSTQLEIEERATLNTLPANIPTTPYIRTSQTDANKRRDRCYGGTRLSHVYPIILGEDGAVDTVIVDYRYMDKTFPVKADGMVDIDNKEFDERKDPDNTHYGSMANRLPPWRESEATELTYSRLVCLQSKADFEAFEWMDVTKMQSRIDEGLDVTNAAQVQAAFNDQMTKTASVSRKRWLGLKSQAESTAELNKIGYSNLPKLWDLQTGFCYPILNRTGCKLDIYNNTDSMDPPNYKYWEDQEMGVSQDDLTQNALSGKYDKEPVHPKWLSPTALHFKEPFRLRTRQEAGGGCSYVDWHRWAQLFLVRSNAQCYRSNRFNYSWTNVYLETFSRMDPQTVYTSYKFGHYHGEGMINSPYEQQTNTSEDSVRDWEFANAKDVNESGVVRYGDTVVIRSVFHSRNDSTNVNRKLKRQYVSLVKQGPSLWHMRTTLRTHPSSHTQFVLVDPSENWDFTNPPIRELRKVVNYADEVILFNKLYNTYVSVYNSSNNEGEWIVGGDGSATRGFRPYDQLTIAPVTDVPNFNYQAKILVPYFASGTNFTDYREIQMTGECKWCQESYESYDIPCYTPRTTKNPYQFCVMENPTPNSEKKVCTRPLW